MKGIGLRTLDMASLIAGAKVHLLICRIIIYIYIDLISIDRWIDKCETKHIRLDTIDMTSLIACAQVWTS